MDSLTQTLFSETNPLRLECGQKLTPVNVAYETYGTLNPDGANAILVCHALTGSASARVWWDPMIGPGRALDTRKYFVICSNVLGSCYGSTGPTSIDPRTGAAYGKSFPPITIRDMVRVQRELLHALGVRKLKTVIGSSLGGMQVLEWALMYPDLCETVIPISISAKQSAWCIALNAAARSAIVNDPVNGLATARMIGMISYRSPQEFEERFGRRKQGTQADEFSTTSLFEVESYLAHQGAKLVQRFDPQTYLCLSRAMDTHDVTRSRGALREVLGGVAARTLCIGISSDVRYPVALQKDLTDLIRNASFAEIESIHGHDAFLIEYNALSTLVRDFLDPSTGKIARFGIPGFAPADSESRYPSPELWRES